jgi:anti-sigma factor RsiW
VALCIARTGAETAGVEVDRRGDLRLASWQGEGYTYVIAGMMSAADAAAVAEQARSQLKS